MVTIHKALSGVLYVFLHVSFFYVVTLYRHLPVHGGHYTLSINRWPKLILLAVGSKFVMMRQKSQAIPYTDQHPLGVNP